MLVLTLIVGYICIIIAMPFKSNDWRVTAVAKILWPVTLVIGYMLWRAGLLIFEYPWDKKNAFIKNGGCGDGVAGD